MSRLALFRVFNIILLLQLQFFFGVTGTGVGTWIWTVGVRLDIIHDIFRRVLVFIGEQLAKQVDRVLVDYFFVSARAPAAASVWDCEQVFFVLCPGVSSQSEAHLLDSLLLSINYSSIAVILLNGIFIIDCLFSGTLLILAIGLPLLLLALLLILLQVLLLNWS
jgi:hypothetical protein